VLYVNIVFLLIYIVVYFASNKGDKEWINIIDKKEHKLYFLYSMSDFILTKTGLYKRVYRKTKITDAIKALNVTSKQGTIQKLYWCSKISLIILILIVFHSFSLLGQLQSYSNTKIQEGKYLMRPEYGKGSEKFELNVSMNRRRQDKTSIEKEEDNYLEDITVQVEERSYSERELKKLFEEAIQYLNISILGSNESAELIYGDLYFCEFIPGTGIIVKWKPEDINLIGRDGTVNNEDIDPNGIKTSISAVLTYQEEQIDYSIQIKIMPKKYSEEERLRIKLEEEIASSLKETKEEKRVELPEVIEDYRLRWKDKEQYSGIKILFVGFLTAALVWFYYDQELNQKMKKRKEQMILDYPEIINKFTLLVNAGMTVKQAWSKISQDYEKKIVNSHSKKRYAYEEMLVTVHELKLGISEDDAYEQFGRRVGLASFMKFGSLIAQNLKKGNKGLSELLTREAIEAFEERKETAKRLGEEAGTKLLAPMMIMLIIVFTIILIPAFLSFGI